ncbi:MAG TPA: DHA2 family efflux MFS transporter permease subunit, partial [Ktedonobacterales bacterium]|nr:DHA2 family efflux MFS transporter permease subunit [Ktedonobacterales bacterium]
LGLFMAILDNTIVNVALPQMAKAFNTNQETITWVVTAYFLAQAAVIPITGYLSDRLGTKVIFLSALALFTIGSGLCAIAPNEQALIAFRVLQGIGGGALFPTVFAIIYRVFPPTERGPASAIIGVPVLLAPAFGPTIGGFLTTNFDWNAIFTVNLPLGAIAFALALWRLHGREDEHAAMGEAPLERKGFDVVGLVLAMGGFTTLVYGITEAGQNGWSNTTALSFMLVGIVLLIMFIVVELRSKDPVMDVRLFTNYTFTAANVLMWAMSAFLFGSLILLPYFFEVVQGKTPLTAGELLIAQGLSAAVSTAVAGALYNRIGPRIMATLGFLLITVGTIGFTQLTVNTTGESLQGWLILRGLGLGLINIPLQTLALAAVSNRAMARASSLVNVTRQVAGAVGVASLTAYLTQQTKDHVPSVTADFKATQLASVQTACIQAIGQVQGAAQAIAKCVQDAATTFVTHHAVTLGLADTFTLVMIACGVCTVLALFVGRDPSIVATRAAKARGEEVEVERPAVAVE